MNELSELGRKMGCALVGAVPGALVDALVGSLPYSLVGSLVGPLVDSLPDSLAGSLADSLPGSLVDSLVGSLPGSVPGAVVGALAGALPDSLVGSLVDARPSSRHRIRRFVSCSYIYESPVVKKIGRTSIRDLNKRLGPRVKGEFLNYCRKPYEAPLLCM